MSMIYPKDAIPWVGLYVAGASLACTLAMAADAFQGFRQWKLWFPNKFFVLNTVSITLIAIAMKLPVDLTTNMSDSNVGEWNGKMLS
uniref:Rho guanyl-nucleotide exchange factor 12 n=2 Tax=Tanacetum cinerariifolium TaxID=118510 RepID=A0A6L2ML10_TANCI|nr:Rho guanyl-nucleotide exchange factor 12 [Tanacetum cinerariifolium]